MSFTQLLYSNSAYDSESYKSLGLNSLHVKNLVVDGYPLVFEISDFTVPVNTYDGANNIVDSDVFSLNIHAIRIGHIIILTVALITFTVVNPFNYFGFSLPADFVPIEQNEGLLFCYLNGIGSSTKYDVNPDFSQFRVYKDTNGDNFLATNAFIMPQQTVTYDNTN